jgi:hypothetical protein
VEASYSRQNISNCLLPLKLDAVTEAIGNGSYDDVLGKLEASITTRRKMMIVKA